MNKLKSRRHQRCTGRACWMDTFPQTDWHFLRPPQRHRRRDLSLWKCKWPQWRKVKALAWCVVNKGHCFGSIYKPPVFRGFPKTPCQSLYEWNCPTVSSPLVTFLLALLRNSLEEFVRLYCHLLTSRLNGKNIRQVGVFRLWFHVERLYHAQRIFPTWLFVVWTFALWKYDVCVFYS